MNKRLLLFPLALLLVLGLAACGGSGGGGSSDEEGEIETVVESSATASDPADCAKYNTLKFMEQTTGQAGAKAEEACEKDAGNSSNPDSVSVSKIEIDGDEATADAAFEGGNFDGQSLTVALVREDGEWKLNEFKGFASFDAKKLTDILVKQLEATGEVTPQVISCIAEGLEELDQAKYEEIVVNQDSRPLIEIVESCE